jgi:endonuclease/exonuclease/phosphatase family metal-dependent hydrolase
MSYNVRAFDLYKWSRNPKAREEIFGLFRKSRPDIICFQEYHSRESGGFTSKDIFEELRETPHHHIHAPLSKYPFKYGLAIFSHFPIVSGGSVMMNTPMNLCTYADIKVFDDTIRVYNLHLQSIRLNSQHYRFMDSLKFRYDNQQMEEIRDISYRLKDAFVKRASQAEAITAHIARCPYEVIVCGDFNDTPVSYAYRTISSGLQDAFIEAGWGVGRTYNGKFPSFRIDFILHGGAMEVVHFTRYKVGLSDHFPIAAFLGKRELHDPVEQIRGWVKKD